MKHFQNLVSNYFSFTKKEENKIVIKTSPFLVCTEAYTYQVQVFLYTYPNK